MGKNKRKLFIPVLTVVLLSFFLNGLVQTVRHLVIRKVVEMPLVEYMNEKPRGSNFILSDCTLENGTWLANIKTRSSGSFELIEDKFYLLKPINSIVTEPKAYVFVIEKDIEDKENNFYRTNTIEGWSYFMARPGTRRNIKKMLDDNNAKIVIIKSGESISFKTSLTYLLVGISGLIVLIFILILRNKFKKDLTE